MHRALRTTVLAKAIAAIILLSNNITLVHAATTTRDDWVPTSTGITVEEAWDQANDYYEDAIEAVDPKDTYKNAIGFDAFDKQIETDIKSGATLDQINTKVSAFVSKTEALIPGFEGVADKQMSRLELEYKTKLASSRISGGANSTTPSVSPAPSLSSRTAPTSSTVPQEDVALTAIAGLLAMDCC
ncbi:hypothetical protein Poli38472_010871 [Pythium oligandrum]|uniref:Uncharacterized protein n=1 Tax=Pythium oligandrum TaxID=41045 RepID=A0A8K1CFX4_PYTOL|nr:hypothetical protein Poli38472_010871 [Pythium oligandrum]|eukprot:TMW61808.1 hypothetical protein Poli38472_010871 [Pythium oligandrum]